MAPEQLVCSTCNTPLPEAASFCYVCGTPTPTATSAESGATVTRPSLSSAAAVIDTRKRLEKALGRHFTVSELVGRGGFAEVFRVRDERLKRDLAVKVLSPELVVNQAMLQRFRREAEAIAALRHPNIVPIYDIGEVEGIAYIVMPLIRGDTLRKRLDQEGRLPIDEARRILRDISGALQIAHDAGLVHRDIKPENIMLDGPSQQVLVMDFGIAKALDPDQTGMTSSGLIVGTPHFMSPEQASGEPVDGRSDQYSLAVLGYRMVTGSHPFDGETTRALLYKQVFETPPPAIDRFPDVPRMLSDALQRGMAKDPKTRYATIQEFSAAISQLESTEHPVPSRSRTVARQARRWRTFSFAAVGTVAVLAGLLIYTSTRSGTGATSTVLVPPPEPVETAAPVDSVAVEVASVVEPQPAPPPPPAETREPPDRSAATTVARAPTRPAPPPAGQRTCAEALAASAWAVAASLCQVEADQGNSAARMALAGMYERGQGVAPDVARAAELYRAEADAGSADAAYRYGAMLEEGRGVAKDMAEAANQYLRGARRGNVPAMRSIARLYATGDGVRRSDTDALEWYRRAAAANDVPSLTRLAELYALGRGVRRDEAEAARLYTRAAGGGDPEAQFALAMAYFNGRGISRSDSLGRVWLQRAAQRGYGPAQEELARRQ